MQNTALEPLLLLLTLVLLSPILTARLPKLRLPTAVAEIAIGMLLGKSGLHLLTINPLLQHLSELGLLYLMFLAGTELQLRRSTDGDGQRGSPLIAVLTFLLTLAVSIVCSWWVTGGQSGPEMWMMALLFTTSSVGIIIPVVRENRLLATGYGQTLLQAAVLADVLTLLLLSTVLTAGSTSSLSPWAAMLALAGWGMLFYAGARLLQRWMAEITQRLPSAQIGVRSALSLFGITLFVTYHLHLELILGAFLAGLLLSLLGQDRHPVLHDKLESIGYGFLFPIFFLSLGAGFDTAQLNTSAGSGLVLLLLAICFLVKIIGALPFALRFPLRHTLNAGILLSTRFTLVIAVAAVGVKLGLLKPAIEQALVVVAVCTVLVSPLWFGQSAKKRFS